MTAPAAAPAALLSFPKSGRTWLKLMLKFYFERLCGLEDLPLEGHETWRALDPRLPRLVVEHDGDPHFKRPDQLPVDRDRFQSFNVLLLVRDPRDILVSLYFEMTRRLRFYETWGFDTGPARDHVATISQFIRGPVGRLETLLAYYRIWERARRHVRRFRLVRYEHVHADARKALAGVVEFLGVPVEPEALAHAVALCRFERMREYEARDAFGSPTLAPGDRIDPESFKVRRGKVGGYVDYLSPGDLAYVDERLRELPDFLACYRPRGAAHGRG